MGRGGDGRSHGLCHSRHEHAGHDLVDEAILFYAETELGPDALPFATGGPSPFELEQRMVSVTKRTYGPNVCVSGLLHDPWPKSGPDQEVK